MKKFAFSLQKVLDYRDRMMALSKETLVKARIERDAAQTAWEESLAVRDRALQDRRALQQKTGLLDINSIRAQMNRFAALDADSRAAAQATIVTQHVFERQTQVYVEKKRDVKAMESLKEKRQKEYSRIARAEEQKGMDENFNARYFRASQEKEAL